MQSWHEAPPSFIKSSRVGNAAKSNLRNATSKGNKAQLARALAEDRGGCVPGRQGGKGTRPAFKSPSQTSAWPAAPLARVDTNSAEKTKPLRPVGTTSQPSKQRQGDAREGTCSSPFRLYQGPEAESARDRVLLFMID